MPAKATKATSKEVAVKPEVLEGTVESAIGKPNKDGLLAGQPISREDYLRVLAKHNKK